ncbi:hypothetical protein [Micromonospora sp. WMMD1082]|uniref:hypothetical protein n=1 Tax=Micromonospora sp. WMMD1082 TaxID=3016104 RepID=UPI0024173926|nr:hypothetical protein [Micromonospora sp. WMMD1082]MDG4795180.1 hypothetical protein [Micromonospora sp. WMMD1082]
MLSLFAVVASIVLRLYVAGVPVTLPDPAVVAGEVVARAQTLVPCLHCIVRYLVISLSAADGSTDVLPSLTLP